MSFKPRRGTARGFFAFVGLAVCLAPLRSGQFEQRYDLTLDRVLAGGPPVYDRRFLLADVIPEPVRRFTNFSGDLSGRYLEALAAASARRPELVGKLRPLAAAILSHQKPDGHFGEPMSGAVEDGDMARLWGNGRLLAGLLAYHEQSGAPEALQSARRIGDFLIEYAPRAGRESVRREYSSGKFASGYVCWTQNIEGLVELHRRTADARYLDLAGRMAAAVEQHPGQHSHGLLTSLRGMLALSEAAQDRRWRRKVERAWERLTNSPNVLAGEIIPEALHPAIARDEGCSQADWLRLNLQLWRLTGRPRYLARAERSLFNAFFMNQQAAGDFGHLLLEENGLGPGAVRAWWCCTLHGLRAFTAVAESVFRWTDGVLHYDLPVDGEGRGGGLAIRARSSLETSASVRLEVLEGARVPLALRAPEWAAELRVRLGGRALQGEAADGFLRLERDWRAGDVLTIEYPMRTRSEADPRRPGRFAVFHGPWLLGVSERRSPFFFDEIPDQNKVLLAEGGAPPPFRSAAGTGAPGPFAVPAARRKIEWIPSGYPVQPQTAALRPLAERTAELTDARWAFWFQRAGEDRAWRETYAKVSLAAETWLPSFLWGLLAGALLAAAPLAAAALWRRRERRRPKEARQ